MSKKKELLAIGATAASCAAAAAGYSFLKNENKSDQPPKKLIETAKDNIFEKKFKHASAAFEEKTDTASETKGEPEYGKDTASGTKGEPEYGEDTASGTKGEPEHGGDTASGTTEHGADAAS